MENIQKKEKINFKKISTIINIFSILLYALSTIIWVQNKLVNDTLKIIAFISLGLYIVLFLIISIFSGKNYNKNLKRYKKLMKGLRTLLKFVNLVVLVISTISLFSFSLKNLVAVILNIILLAINIMQFLFKLYIYFIKVTIRKVFKIEKKNSFLGFVFDDELEKEED